MADEIVLGRCPRCDFEQAMSLLCYVGEYIRGHLAADAPGQLSPSEIQILELAHAWAADDAITRCLADDAADEDEDDLDGVERRDC